MKFSKIMELAMPSRLEHQLLPYGPMRKPLFTLAGSLVLLFAASASAAEVRYELDSADQFIADGWTSNAADNLMPAFANGQMTVTSSGYNEWILYNDPNSPTRWWNYVNAQKGWWIEARLQILQGPDTATCFDGGPGIWMHDGTSLIKFTFTKDQARISYPMVEPINMDPTDGFHVYRIQNLGGSHIQVLVDGTMQLDVTLTSTGGGTEGITLGDLGGCGPSSAIWDYFAYDTAAPGTEADDTDADGIPADVDVCADVADPDQVDTDGDRLGDACDDCPNDPLNDADKDGLCGDVDICPNSPDNTDSNNNGICDSMECLNMGLPQPGNGIPCVGAAVPGVNPCQCFFGVDPIMDPAPPPPSGGSGGTANAGAGGSTMSGGASSFFHTGGSSGGSAGRGGSNGTGGSGATNSMNQTASGGTPTGNGSNAAPGASASQSGAGCSLTVPRGSRDGGPLLLPLMGLGLAAVRRRRAI